MESGSGALVVLVRDDDGWDVFMPTPMKRVSCGAWLGRVFDSPDESLVAWRLVARLGLPGASAPATRRTKDLLEKRNPPMVFALYIEENLVGTDAKHITICSAK